MMEVASSCSQSDYELLLLKENSSFESNIDRIAESYGEDSKELYDYIAEAGGGIISKVIEFIKKVLLKIKDLFNKMIDFILRRKKKSSSSGSSISTNISNVAKKEAQKLSNDAKEVLKGNNGGLDKDPVNKKEIYEFVEKIMKKAIEEKPNGIAEELILKAIKDNLNNHELKSSMTNSIFKGKLNISLTTPSKESMDSLSELLVLLMEPSTYVGASASFHGNRINKMSIKQCIEVMESMLDSNNIVNKKIRETTQDLEYALAKMKDKGTIQYLLDDKYAKLYNEIKSDSLNNYIKKISNSKIDKTVYLKSSIDANLFDSMRVNISVSEKLKNIDKNILENEIKKLDMITTKINNINTDSRTNKTNDLFDKITKITAEISTKISNTITESIEMIKNAEDDFIRAIVEINTIDTLKITIINAVAS